MSYFSNQSILKEISTEYSLEGLMLKLKLQYFGHLMQRSDSLKRPWCWERLRAGGEGDDRGWDGWMASQTRWTSVWVNSRSWRAAIHGIAKSRTRLSDGTELKILLTFYGSLYSSFTFLEMPPLPSVLALWSLVTHHHHLDPPQGGDLCSLLGASLRSLPCYFSYILSALLIWSL